MITRLILLNENKGDLKMKINKKYTIYLPDTEHVEILPDNEKSSDKILDELLNDIIALNKV